MGLYKAKMVCINNQSMLTVNVYCVISLIYYILLSVKVFHASFISYFSTVAYYLYEKRKDKWTIFSWDLYNCHCFAF